MSNNFPRLCVSSTGGGGGKTLLCLGLGRLLSQKGFHVKPFKKGPDYIDSAWLTKACNCETTNLDPFFLDSQELIKLFVTSCQAVPGPRLAIIEGNRGLYDGLDETGSCSTASLARILAAPILLSINCAKSTRTIAAILSGLMNFESNLDFCGVVLSRIASPRHETAIRKALERTVDIPVLGVIPRLDINPLPERHMGLATMGGDLDAETDKALNELAKLVEKHCDLEKIIDSFQSAPEINWGTRPHDAPIHVTSDYSPQIGYVCDEAIWFYYPENLEALRAQEAKTVKLSLFEENSQNRAAWDRLDGLYLGGGFPEDFGDRLEKSEFLGKIYQLAQKGLPVYAECGGLILLCAGLARGENYWKMSGVFDLDIQWHPKPQGLGYVAGKIIASNPFFPLGTYLKGHEFHYSQCLWKHAAAEFALKLDRGIGLCQQEEGFDGMTYKNVWASYTHIFAPSCPVWAPHFVKAAREYHQKNLSSD